MIDDTIKYAILNNKNVTEDSYVPSANYNIVRHASSMLIASKLPKNFYSEAQSTAVYLYNRTVH